MKWLKFDPSRKNRGPEILRGVDLTNFSLEFLETVVQKEEFVNQDNESLRFLLATVFRLINMV